jgi:hypothetical protein
LCHDLRAVFRIAFAAEVFSLEQELGIFGFCNLRIDPCLGLFLFCGMGGDDREGEHQGQGAGGGNLLHASDTKTSGLPFTSPCLGRGGNRGDF